jgi:putative ABC transport system ATP-binding protein
MKLELRDVALGYGEDAPLHRNISLVVGRGGFILIEGPSGSGKSSLLRLMNRLQEPTGGEILLDDRPIRDYDVTSLRRRIGYVQQTPVMLEGSVADNLLLPFRFRSARQRTSPDRDRLRALMDELLLHDVELSGQATQLSVGQKQRVALIRAVLTEPEILLCDEPSSALDPESRDIVQASLERLNVERQMTLIVVTHFDFHPKRVSPQRYRLTRRDGLREAPA